MLTVEQQPSEVVFRQSRRMLRMKQAAGRKCQAEGQLDP